MKSPSDITFPKTKCSNMYRKQPNEQRNSKVQDILAQQ